MQEFKEQHTYFTAVQICQDCPLGSEHFNSYCDKVSQPLRGKTTLDLRFIRDVYCDFGEQINPQELFDLCEVLWIGQNPHHSYRGTLGTFSRADGETLTGFIDHGILGRSAFTNLVKCSVEGDAITDEHVLACFKWLERDIELVNPRVIVYLGSLAKKYHKMSFGEVKEATRITYSLPHPGVFKYGKNKSHYEKMYRKAMQSIRERLL
jgi:uracil-DNA glycosylase family 4